MLLLLIFVSIFALSSSSCSSNSIQWNSKCYTLYTNNTQFVTAAYFCKNIGGDLVSIHDAFVNSLLNDYVSNHVHDVFKLDFWTGASKMFTPNTWTWLDGTPFDYNVWDVMEPRNATWANCTAVFVPSGKWSALDCTTKRPFFCQFPLVKPTGCNV
uniref:C-type lectin domain-containing protein n=1 Tax=Panagrolaimus superbus TaxID=310955 RepID=A0A914YAM4_9BILA